MLNENKFRWLTFIMIIMSCHFNLSLLSVYFIIFSSNKEFIFLFVSLSSLKLLPFQFFCIDLLLFLSHFPLFQKLLEAFFCSYNLSVASSKLYFLNDLQHWIHFWENNIFSKQWVEREVEILNFWKISKNMKWRNCNIEKKMNGCLIKKQQKLLSDSNKAKEEDKDEINAWYKWYSVYLEWLIGG